MTGIHSDWLAMFEKFGISKEEQDQFEAAQKRPWSKDEFPQVAAWLEANRLPLAKITEAAKCPRCNAPLVPVREPPMMAAPFLIHSTAYAPISSGVTSYILQVSTSSDFSKINYSSSTALSSATRKPWAA